MNVAIAGYGNLGRGVEAAVTNAPDMELVGVFTRRDPSLVKTATGTPAYALDDIASFADKIDVVVICGGSATDLPKQTPELAKQFCVVDSFDTHANIPQHFANVDAAAREAELSRAIDIARKYGLQDVIERAVRIEHLTPREALEDYDLIAPGEDF